MCSCPRLTIPIKKWELISFHMLPGQVKWLTCIPLHLKPTNWDFEGLIQNASLTSLVQEQGFYQSQFIQMGNNHDTCLYNHSLCTQLLIVKWNIKYKMRITEKYNLSTEDPLTILAAAEYYLFSCLEKRNSLTYLIRASNCIHHKSWRKRY